LKKLDQSTSPFQKQAAAAGHIKNNTLLGVLTKILLYAAVLPSYILNPNTYRFARVNKYYTCGGEYYKWFA
jgi:hypothetical protein